MAREWLTMSAADLGRGIGTGEIDPVALTEAFLHSAGAQEHAGRIYARLTPERALAEAAAAHDRARQGVRRGVLDGVPISWKDNFDTAGIITEAGSALLRGRMPDRDAAVVANATQAGLVCLGKTHLSEFAFSGLGLNPVTATPPNVNDPGAVPGGSSSGAATSVAFGLAPAGVGSDTGGSVRIPAAWNDLVGLKTTHGLLPTSGVVPLCERFDTVGPLTRTVEDAGLLLAALGGTRAPDLRGAKLRGRRLAVLETCAFDDIRDTPRAGFEAAVARLAAAGAHIDRFALPELHSAMDRSGIIFTAEAYAIWRETIEADPGAMFERILDRFRQGATFAAADYAAAWRILDRLRALWLERTAAWDAVLVPTAPNMPPDARRLMDDPEYYVTENLLTLRNTRIANLIGLCALTLPSGTPSVGISLLAAPHAEARLLRLGAAAEAALRGTAAGGTG